ncbi:MAG: HAD hydrolase-like protein [Candidatus Woesearchaeota archaeon]
MKLLKKDDRINTDKPIIATTLSGLFVKSSPWKKAHKLWFDFVAHELNDESIKEWMHRKDYFKGVDIAMKKLYPKKSNDERTKIARTLYFNCVFSYIRFNKDKLINKDVISYFLSIKKKYRIALVSTNSSEHIKELLSIIDISDFFDIIECSKPEEKDDKIKVFSRFLKKYKKPAIYIGGDRKDTYEFCKKHKINYVFANFENADILPKTKFVSNLNELKKLL